MKISQNSKKRRKPLSEYYQNGFNDGEGTKKNDYNKISRVFGGAVNIFNFF